MSYGIGGYQLIDLKGIDLINEETLNTSVYAQIENANKNKPLCLVNIVKDKVEYQAEFINVKLDNDRYTFYLQDRFIKVSPTKVESLPTFVEKTIENDDLININDLLNYNCLYKFNVNGGTETITTINIEAKSLNTKVYNLIIVNPPYLFKFSDNVTESLDEIEINTAEYSYDPTTNNYDNSITIRMYNLEYIFINVENNNIYINLINGYQK